MNFISFLNDLGIIPNKGTCYEKNASLNQGQEFMDYNRMHLRKERNGTKSIQKTTMPGVTSIIENMQNMKPNASTQSNNKVMQIEKEFNKTLAEYQVVYKDFTEQVLKSNKNDKEIKQYFDQIVTTGDGNYSYVNDYGFTQKYSTDAWSANAENCPNDPMTVSKDLMAKFQIGSIMGKGQPCDVAGKNVQNTKTGEYAWVDIKGKKHVYSDKLWKKKNESCNIPAISLSDAEYKAIPSGGNMRPTDECIQLKVDPRTLLKMNKLNDKMEKLAKEMIVEIDHLAIEDVELNMAMNEQRALLNNHITKINKDRDQINFYKQDAITVMAEEEDSFLRERSTQLHFFAWFFLVITIFALLMHTFLRPRARSSTIDNVVVVIGLVFIFVVCKAIYDKYYYYF